MFQTFFLQELKKCSNLNNIEKNMYGCTKWHYLAYSGNYEALYRSIDKKRFDPSIITEHGSTIWHMLALSGNYEALCKAIDEKRCDPSIITKDGTTIWHNLARSGNYEALCKAIDEKRFDPSIKDNGSTIWHFLAYSGNYESFCKAMDEKRFDSSITDSYGRTVWYYLALSGNYDSLCKAIDKKQFDLSIKTNNGNTIWHYLARSDNYEALCKAYKIYKFDINIIPTKYRYLLKETPKVQLLIEKLSDKLNNIEIPDDFRCGISREIMSDPVLTEYGQLYDRHYIEKWLKTSDKDPLTNTKLSSKILYSDLRTKRDIEQFLEKLM